MFSLNKAAKSAADLVHRWHDKIDDHVIGLAWAPDGQALAAAAISGPITLFDSTTGKPRHTLPGHSFGTAAIAWHPRKGRLASAGQDGKVTLWDASTGGQLATMAGGAAWVEHLAWQPGGDLLASAAGKKLRLWDTAGQLVHEYPDHSSTIADVQWRPDGKEFASASYGCISLWGPKKTEPIREFKWQGSQLVLAWSPDGKYLATGDQDSTVHFWIVETGKDLQMSGYERKVRELAWDATSRYLATGGGVVPCVWDTGGKGPAGTKPVQLEGHAKPVTALIYQQDGPLLASAGEDGRLFVWQPNKDKKPRATLRLDSGLTHIAWSPDDRAIALGTESGRVAVYDLPSFGRKGR